MSFFQKIQNFNDAHQSKFLDGIRVVLGVVIFIKGYLFIRNTDLISQMLANSKVEYFSIIIAHYVAMVHLFGGFLIAIGLITRVAILFQLPILIGAIFFVHARQTIFSFNAEYQLSIIVFILLLFYLVYGSGTFSVDYYMSKHKNE